LTLLDKSRVALVLAALSILTAYAAEPKPDFSIKTKSIETNVSLDTKDKADSALAIAAWALACTAQPL